ncbi:UNVERIFIED_CONTAM: hypothetical protein Sradi_2508500 [Sesamum radiatum]|uniref:CCHC-type domain-containing protein n=1 Tax=Sesamum radiatum TaxID=300843 RepID=A0AAW2SLD0_SESRA
MLRRCPHHELPAWWQVQTFYNGVTLANRATIDATAGGTIMKKLLSETFNVIDEIATNLYSYGLERTDKRVVDIHRVNAITTLSAQMAALTQKVDNLGAAIWNGAPVGPCGACGQMEHLSQDCKVGSQISNHEDANFVSHGGRSNFNPNPTHTIWNGVATPICHGVIINNKDHQEIINHNIKPRKKRRAM